MELVKAPKRQRERAALRARAQTRLSKKDIYETLKLAYGTVRAWKCRDKAGEIRRLLRREASPNIAAQSSLFLVLLRSAIPDLDAKRASKWAAALELADRKDLPTRKFVGFVEAQGGVEGAARTMARLRALVDEIRR